MGDIQALVEFSKGLTDPLLIHLQRSGLLSPWLEYVVDNWIVSLQPGITPRQEDLLWIHDIKTESELQEWASVKLRSPNVPWHILVASAKWEYCLNHPDLDIESLYLAHVYDFITYTYDLYDCSLSHGLAVEIYDLLSTNYSPEDVSSRFPSVYKPKQITSHLDTTSPIPELLSTIQPNDILPPFYTGESWVVLRLVSCNRPGLQDIQKQLIRLWFNKHYHTIVADLSSLWSTTAL